MKIGITYDLREHYLRQGYSEEETAEFDRPDTIEAIADTLQQLGHSPDRIGNIRSLVDRLASGDRWELVFNIAEGLNGYGREAQIPALLDAYGIPYTFSDPLVLSLSLHKGMTKRIIESLGLPTPDFAVVSSEQDLEELRLEYPLFAKPIAEGTAKGITAHSVISDTKELKQQCLELLSRYRQPVLVEEFLPGREYTVGILGTGDTARAVGTMEVILLKEAEQDVYSYVNKERCEELVHYQLVTGREATLAEGLSLELWRAMGCRDAGRIDLREDRNGHPGIMEINPLAGLHPEHSDLPILCAKIGIEYRDLIRQILDSAADRVPVTTSGPADHSNSG